MRHPNQILGKTKGGRTWLPVLGRNQKERQCNNMKIAKQVLGSRDYWQNFLNHQKMLKIPARQQMYSNKWKLKTTIMSYLCHSSVAFPLGLFSTSVKVWGGEHKSNNYIPRTLGVWGCFSSWEATWSVLRRIPTTTHEFKNMHTWGSRAPPHLQRAVL